MNITRQPPGVIRRPQDLKRNHNNALPRELKRIRIKYKSVFFRFYRRKLAALIRLLIQRPLLIVSCWLALSILGLITLYMHGADVEQENSEDSVYAQIEFEGGLHLEETDRLLAGYGAELKNHPGIRSVQTVARTGTGSTLVSFDPKITNNKAVRSLMRDTSISGGFVYIAESSGNERNWRIRIAGDEGKRCQDLAAEAARRCASLPEISETVLNFKEGSPRINLLPDRERIAQNGLSFTGIGQTVRRNIHGPVAYKRIGSNGETDVRILGGNSPLSREETLEILVKGETSPLILDMAVDAESTNEAASIQRENRRRSASITIRTKAMDPRKARDMVMPALSEMELPPGYSVEFDPEALKAAEKVSSQGFLFVLALLFCYMALAVLKESFSFPFAILAAVPPSLAVPALYMVFRNYPLNVVSAAAFVAVSGLAINAAAIVADAFQHTKPEAVSCYKVFRRCLPVLAAATITTIAGAAPFLFIKSSTALVVKTLSLVSALGVAASALCAVTLIPALIKLFPRLLKSSENSEEKIR